MALRTSLVAQPHLYMGDTTGRPLDAGKVYFGEPNKDPELYPIDVYYDEALTIAAPQPIRTKGGFMNANGDMVEIYAAETTYSVKVLDSYGRQVFYQTEMSSTSTSASVSTKLPYPNAVNRTQSSKNSDTVSVKDFGAVGDGVTDDTAAILLMQAALGYVIFSAGSYLVNNEVNITVPVTFQAGAYIENNTTINISNTITAQVEYIFRGSGAYNLKNISGLDNSEGVRDIHVAWFGAITQTNYLPAECIDVAPFIQKAFNAVGNTRESIVNFSIGNYIVRTPMFVPRGCLCKGAGIRRTVFKTDLDNFDIFTTDNTACGFEGVQQENFLTDLPVRTNGYFIVLNHPLCYVDSAVVQGAAKSILVRDDAHNCSIENIYGFFGNPISIADSSLVEINGASNTRVRNIRVPQSSNSPESVVLIKTTSKNASYNNISDLYTQASSSLVKIKSTLTSAVTSTRLNGFSYGAFSGVKADVIKLETIDAGKIDGLVISNFTLNSYPKCLLSVAQGSTGNVKNIVINTGAVEGAGDLINVNRTSGNVTDIRIGNAVITTREVVTVGSNITGVVDLSKSNITKSRSVTVDNDGVAIIDAPRLYGNSLRVITNSREYLDGIVRTETTARVTAIAISTNVETASTVLTGTTGAAGKITVGASGGKVYIENRTGSSITVEVTV